MNKITFIYLFFTTFFLTSCFSDNHPVTPEETALAYFKAINNGKIDDVTKYVFPTSLLGLKEKEEKNKSELGVAMHSSLPMWSSVEMMKKAPTGYNIEDINIVTKNKNEAGAELEISYLSIIKPKEGAVYFGSTKRKTKETMSLIKVTTEQGSRYLITEREWINNK